MSEVQRLEVTPVLPESCSQEELQKLEAVGKSGIREVEDYFSEKNRKISDKDFQQTVTKVIWTSVDRLILTLFLKSQKHREDFLRKMDGWKTKLMEQEITSWKDIRPVLMEMIGTTLVTNSEDYILLVELVTQYEAWKKGMTENEYSNYLESIPK